MRNKAAFIRIFILLLLGVLCGTLPVAASTAADEGQNPPLAALPLPADKTVISMISSAITLDLYEDVTGVHGVYTLINASDEKAGLTLLLPASASAPVLSLNGGLDQEPFLLDANKGLYLWQIPFEPNERRTVRFAYGFTHAVDEDGILSTGLQFSSENLWSAISAETTVNIRLKELTPAHFLLIEPQEYTLDQEGFSFIWDGPPDTAELRLVADLLSVKKAWKIGLSKRETSVLETFNRTKNYRSAALLYANKYKKAPRRERLPFLTAQAYYLERAGFHEEAWELWEELYDEEERSPYIYWYLGQEEDLSYGRRYDLYAQARELQIHPLLQRWLAAPLPESRFKRAKPETVSVRASTQREKDGLLLSGSFSDADGDIEKITLLYRLENNTAVEREIALEQFQYTHYASYFIPLEKTMQKVYYQFSVTDADKNTLETEQRETFFLTSEIQSATYPLRGAKLVLGSYLPPEQEKVYNWFKSYLQSAASADFIPLGGKDPYFIFLGQYHPLIDTYQGPLFLLHTPAPFSPVQTKPAVHRYFLTYWYGAGWEEVPEALLLNLGDGLLLGKGDYVRILRYLQASDSAKFYQVLNAVGAGGKWESSLQDIYQMPLTEIKLRSLWFAHGNKFLAVVIIIGFAWLGKSGLLVRLIRTLR